MKLALFSMFKAYAEVLRTGSVESRAEGEYLSLILRGSVDGDILAFICPRTNDKTEASVLQLIDRDPRLVEQKGSAFRELRYKYMGLALLPKIIVWAINLTFGIIIFRYQGNTLLNMITGQIAFQVDPLVISWGGFTLLILVYTKSIGFLIIRPLINLISRIIRLRYIFAK